jgi:type IV secretory pathway TrbF-like protein
LLVVPASLLVIPLLDLFGLFQSAIVKEQISYDIARYAALADVTAEQAESYRQSRDPLSRLNTDVSISSCSLVSSSELSRRITFWPETITIQIQGRAECEN